MAANIISIAFLSRDIAHKEHLKTSSYAQHMALGDFYTGIICFTDQLAEAYQGRNGIIEDIPIKTIKNAKGSIIDKLQLMLDMIETARYSEIEREDTAIQNIVDEIVGLYLSTLYKLKNLK